MLVRAAHHSDLVEVELTVRRIPYRKFGGLRFLEAAHVKDFVAAARLLDNPKDEVAWFRLLRLHQGIGPARALAMVEALAPARGDALSSWPEAVATAPAAVRTALSSTLDGLVEARGRGSGGERAAAVLRTLTPLIRQHYVDHLARLGDLDRLVGTAAMVDDLAGWLAELTLDPPASTGDLAGPPHLDEDYVSISTIHSAKGLEWPVVHIPHLVDGAFPSDMALDSPVGLAEERRLFYVAVTRAKDELSLYTPLRLPAPPPGRGRPPQLRPGQPVPRPGGVGHRRRRGARTPVGGGHRGRLGSRRGGRGRTVELKGMWGGTGGAPPGRRHDRGSAHRRGSPRSGLLASHQLRRRQAVDRPGRPAPGFATLGPDMRTPCSADGCLPR